MAEKQLIYTIDIMSAEKNAHGVVPRRHQQQFVKIWAGVFGDCLLGP